MAERDELRCVHTVAQAGDRYSPIPFANIPSAMAIALVAPFT